MIWFSSAAQTLAALPAQCNSTFFGIPPWYKYLPMKYDAASGVCSVDDSFKLLGLGADSGLILIGLAIIDMLLRVAGMVAVGFVIWGGIKYLTSQGEASELSAAKHTIINALVGLVIAMVGTSLVVFVGNRLAG
jgi:hypothetical protein